MEASPLEKRLMADATRWRLGLLIDDVSVEMVAHAPGADNDFIHRRIDLDTTASSPLKALEDAVYDNPLLLADYGRIDILLDGSPVIMAPREADAADADLLAALVEARTPGFAGEILAETLRSPAVTVVSGHNREMMGFLRRTFVNPHLAERLTPLLKYAATRRSNIPAMTVSLGRNHLDIVVMDRGNLLMANSFRFTTPEDALYYIMAVRRETTDDRAGIFLTGDSELREQLFPMLRRFVAQTMPLLFPSDLYRSGGAEAMNSPFPLIILPLCE